MAVFDKKAVNGILRILCTGILLVFVLWNLKAVLAILFRLVDVLTPVTVGLCIAFVLHPLVDAIEHPLENLPIKNKKNWWPALCRGVGIVAALAVVAGVFTLLVFIILPEVTATIQGIAAEIPYYVNKLRAWAEQLPALWAFIESQQIDFTQLQIDWQKLALTVTDFLTNSAGSMVTGVLGATATIFSVLMDGVFGFIIAMYVLAQKEQIGRFCKRFVKAFLPEKPGEYLFHVTRVADEAFTNFVSGQLIEALVIAVLCYIGMSLFGFPYALTIATVVGFTALIPVFGAWIGALFGALLILTVSPMQALLFLVFLVVLQQLEGNLIYPRVVGKTVGLPGLLVMLSVLIGGNMFGVVGMLVGVPVCSVLYTLLREAMAEQLKKKAYKAPRKA